MVQRERIKGRADVMVMLNGGGRGKGREEGARSRRLAPNDPTVLGGECW